MKLQLLALCAATTFLTGCSNDPSTRDVPEEFFEEIAPEPPAAPVNVTGSVAISGNTVINGVLTAAVTDTNMVSGAVVYAWFADGAAIAGADQSTYTLTLSELAAEITVQAVYTDDDGFAEDVLSTPTAAVTASGADSIGLFSLDAPTAIVVGQPATTTLTDGNGISTAVTYEWSADGMVIGGADSASYTPVAGDLGKVLSVSANYIDDDGYVTDLDAAADDGVYSFVVDSETALVAAAGAAVSGDIIGIASVSNLADDYNDMAFLEFPADSVTVTLTSDSTAVISGATCLQFSGDNMIIDGLTFDAISMISSSTCDSNGDSSVYLSGDSITLRNSSFLSEADDNGASTFNWISVKGFATVIERNRFTDTEGTKNQEAGAIITIFNNASADDQEGHIIRYNLFEDFGIGGADGSRNSSAYMIQLGRSTSETSLEDGLNLVAYNLFQNVNLDRRYMRVQSNFNTVDHNTFLDSSGMVAFEDGEGNTATNNIFINTGDTNADDGGISYSAFGHTISNNYIAGLRTTSGQRAGLLANSEVMENGAGDSDGPTGNSVRTIANVVVANNTILNSREAIEFGSDDCSGTRQFIVEFTANLVANGEDDMMAGIVAGNLNNGTGREGIQDDCALAASSDFDNNAVYSEVFTNSGSNTFFTDFAGASGNVGSNATDSEGSADMGVDPDNGLLFGQGVDAGRGADTSELELLDASQVGPGSTWLPL